MSLHSFEWQRSLSPKWCQICAGLVFSLSAYNECSGCGLIAHEECTGGLPATCKIGNFDANNNNTHNTTQRTDHIKPVIDNVLVFPEQVNRFFFLGMSRVNCVVCSDKLAEMKLTFPDQTYVLACQPCAGVVRKHYANLLPKPSNPAASKPRSSKKKSASGKPRRTASTKAQAPPPKPSRSSKPRGRAPAVKQQPSQHAPAPPASSSSSSSSQSRLPRESRRRAADDSSSGVTKDKRRAARRAERDSKPQQEPARTKAPQPPRAAPQPQQPEDVSNEALQYCDAGNRVFESDALAACQHYQRAANAQAQELAGRSGAPSLRARRTLAVCHANVSAARLVLKQPDAALVAAQHAIAADPTWPRPVFRKVKALLMMQRTDEAMETLRVALQRFPESGELRALHAETQRSSAAHASQRRAPSHAASNTHHDTSEHDASDSASISSELDSEDVYSEDFIDDDDDDDVSDQDYSSSSDYES